MNAQKCILALSRNLTFTRSSLLRRSMTLMMKSLAIWKFCRPMLSELSNTKRRSTGPQVHSIVRHRSGGACVFSFSEQHILQEGIPKQAVSPGQVGACALPTRKARCEIKWQNSCIGDLRVSLLIFPFAFCSAPLIRHVAFPSCEYP